MFVFKHTIRLCVYYTTTFPLQSTVACVYTVTVLPLDPIALPNVGFRSSSFTVHPSSSPTPLIVFAHPLLPSLRVVHRAAGRSLILSSFCVACVYTVTPPFLDTSQIQRRCPPIYNFLPPCHLDTSCACITPRLSSSKHRCLCLHSNYTSPHLQPSPTSSSPGCRVPIIIVTQSPCSTQLLVVKQSSCVLLLCKQ